MAKKLGQRYIGAFGQDYFMGTFKKYGPEGLVDLESPLIKKMFIQAKILFEAQKIKGFGEIHIDNKSPNGNDRSIPLINPVDIEDVRIDRECSRVCSVSCPILRYIGVRLIRTQ